MKPKILPLIKLMYPIFPNGKLTVIKEEICVAIKYFDTEIILYCTERDDNLVLVFSAEPDQMFSKTNYERQRDMVDYEYYFIKILQQLGIDTAVNINVTVKIHSIEASVISYKKLEDRDIINLFLAIKYMDEIYAGIPVEEIKPTSKTV